MQAADKVSAELVRPGIKLRLVLFAIGLVPIIALGVYAYHSAAGAIGALVQASNRTVAEVAGELVRREFEHRVNVLTELARSQEFRTAVRSHDESAVRERLSVLVESHPRVVRAFVADPEGLLWSDFPRAKESLGQTFAHREWYIGVSRAWQPYVSGVYRRHAAPQLLLVAIAAPVRERDDGPVAGIVVYQITLEDLTRILGEVQVGQNGYVIVLDHAGTVAVHPGLPLQERIYREYAGTPPVAAARHSASGVDQYRDPLTRTDMLASAASLAVGVHRWTVIAQQPAAEAYAPRQRLALHIGGAGLLVMAVTSGLFAALARYYQRGRQMTLRLAELNAALDTENQQRRPVEQALQEANWELESQVEERTRELRQTEDQLLQAQKLEAIGQLAGGIAHDFNNVLTVIIGYCDVLLLELSEDDPVRRRIEQMYSAGKRATSLTGQLLAFSRKQVLQPEILDLNAVVANMTSMLERLIGEDVVLHTKFAPSLDPVEVDPGQIEQILMNLAVNARDAMPKGGNLSIETANVHLDQDYAHTHTDAKPGPHVMIAISDTGIGMDAETRARLFEPFFTTKGPAMGTGLGLSTVYGIVKQSGGNIWVYSEPGRGTVFKIYLPRSEAAVGPSVRKEDKAALQRGTETILLVEDDKDVRTFIRDVLEMGGYTVLAAGDADQAHTIAGEHEGWIDLLLTDVVLPEKGGPDIARELEAIRPGLTVAFMSGYTNNAIVPHGVLEPGTNFIQKPVEMNVLLTKVREFLT